MAIVKSGAQRYLLCLTVDDCDLTRVELPECLLGETLQSRMACGSTWVLQVRADENDAVEDKKQCVNQKGDLVQRLRMLAGWIHVRMICVLI
jgi:hypothetical protein